MNNIIDLTDNLDISTVWERYGILLVKAKRKNSVYCSLSMEFLVSITRIYKKMCYSAKPGEEKPDEEYVNV